MELLDPTQLDTRGGYPGPALGLPKGFAIYAVPKAMVFGAVVAVRATHLISITDPAAAIRLETLPAGLFIQRSEFLDDDDPDAPGSPALEDIKQILGFTAAAADDARIVVHCNGGIARSTAVAYAILVQTAQRAQGRPLRHLRPRSIWMAQAIPTAQPNRLVLSLADKLMHYGGRLAAQAQVVRELLDEQQFDGPRGY